MSYKLIPTRAAIPATPINAPLFSTILLKKLIQIINYSTINTIIFINLIFILWSISIKILNDHSPPSICPSAQSACNLVHSIHSSMGRLYSGHQTQSSLANIRILDHSKTYMDYHIARFPLPYNLLHRRMSRIHIAGIHHLSWRNLVSIYKPECCSGHQ